MTKKCLCNTPKCAKCLVVGCKDANCPTHSKIDKIRAKTRMINELEESFEKLSYVTKTEEFNKYKQLFDDYIALELCAKKLEELKRDIEGLKN